MNKIITKYRRFKMFKKSIILVVVAVAVLATQNASALSWGKINATPDMSVAYVERYGQQEINLNVQYQPYYFGYLPAFVEVNVVGSPTWLTVAASPQTFTLKPGETLNVKLLLKVSQNDIVAGTSGEVQLQITARLVTGGSFRQIDEAKLTIIVGYNPYTEIGIRAVQPIERTAPDRELPFSFDVINYGNTRVIVDLSPAKQPGEWKYVISPPTVVIQPKKPGDETYPYATVTVTLTSPHGTAISYHNNWQDFAIKAKATSEAPYYIKQGTGWTRTTQEIPLVNTHEVTAYFLAKNKGFYVPGFDAIAMIAAIALISLVMTRRKK